MEWYHPTVLSRQEKSSRKGWPPAGAVDTHAPGLVNWAGYWALRGVQIESWRQYMQYILTTLKTLDPSAHQGSTPEYNIVNGEWNQSPSQAYILNNVCQA